MSTLKTNTLTGTTSAGSIVVTGEGGSNTTNLQQGLAKVWGVLTNAAALTNSFNIASGTDNGTGDYSYALTTAFGNANHATTAITSGGSAGRMCTSNTARTSASIIAIEIETHSGVAEDLAQEVSTHGDLA